MDNHGTIKKIGCIRVAAISFNRAFQFVRTHICTKEPLSGNSKKDIPLLFDSLRYGRCYAAMEYFQPAKGFSFVVVQNNEEYSMGDTLILGDRAQIVITLPVVALVRIIKNGTLRHEETNTNINLGIEETGVYRVEVYLKGYGKYRPWIFSNHIFVK